MLVAHCMRLICSNIAGKRYDQLELPFTRSIEYGQCDFQTYSHKPTRYKSRRYGDLLGISYVL